MCIFSCLTAVANFSFFAYLLSHHIAPFYRPLLSLSLHMFLLPSICLQPKSLSRHFALSFCQSPFPSLPLLHPPFFHCLFHLKFFRHLFPFSLSLSLILSLVNPSFLPLHPLYLSPLYLPHCVCRREESEVCLTAAPLGVCVCAQGCNPL